MNHLHEFTCDLSRCPEKVKAHSMPFVPHQYTLCCRTPLTFHFSQVITVRNEVAKVMFLHLSAILFTEGGERGSASVHAGIPGPPGPGTPLDLTPLRTRHPLGPGTPRPRHPSSRRRLLRTVRILLECILVKFQSPSYVKQQFCKRCSATECMWFKKARLKCWPSSGQQVLHLIKKFSSNSC